MAGPSLGIILLVAPGLLALAAVCLHAWHVKGRPVALAFFGASFVFGLLRGNFIGWFMRDASRQLGMGGDGGLMPYVMRAPLLRIGYASLFECLGWMLALYLGWTLSEQVLRRIPALERRLFPLLLLASIFTASLGYAVEAGANAMHWWTWTLPLQSKLLIELPAAGLWAWFSVAFDFLFPFLLLLERPRPGRHWLALLLFPAHMASNLLDLLANRQGWADLGPPSWLAHLGMLAALLLLAPLSRREVSLPIGSEPASGGWRWLPVASAGLVLTVLWIGIGPIAGRTDLWVATSAFLVFVLLAVPSVPLWSVALLAALCAPLAGGRGLAAAVPLLALGFLAGVTTPNRRRLVTASVVCALALALCWQVALSRAERAYLRARLFGADWPRALHRLEALSTSLTGLHLAAANAFASSGNFDLAIDAYRAALRLEPNLAPAHNGLGIALLNLGRAAEAAEAFQQAAGLVPLSEGLHQNLGLAQLSAGRLDAAQTSFATAHQLDPEDPRPSIGLARVAVAAGRAEDGVRILTEALGKGDDVEIHLALGVLHQDAGHFELAEQQFQQAIGRASGASASNAYCQLAVLLASRPDRLPDAGRAAESAVASNRTDATLDTLGWVRLREGRLAEAHAVLLEALDLSQPGPVRKRIQQHLAQASP